MPSRWGTVVVAGLIAAGAAGLSACTTTVRIGGGSGQASLPCRSVCRGTIAEADYAIRLPARWNGTLLIYAHGYHHDQGQGPGRPSLAFGDTSGAGDGPVAGELLRRGFGLAGSSYDRAGWTVASAVRSVVALRSRAVALIAPRRTYVWGGSMGGLIAELVAERHPEWVDGAAPLCGVLAGPLATFDHLLGAAVAARALLEPGLRVAGFDTAAQGSAAAEQARRAVERAARDTAGDGAARVLFLAAALGLGGPSRHHDASTLLDRVRAAAESLTAYLDFALTTRAELERRTGGEPSSTPRLTARLPAARAADIRTMHAEPRALATAVQAAPVLRADPAARATLAATGEPTGRVLVPTVTLHTEFDPIVLPAGETLFGARVRAARRGANLLPLYVAPPARFAADPGAPFGTGHCNLSTRQVVGVVRVLDSWVTTGTRPSTRAQAVAIGPALARRFDPGPWPAALSR